MKSEVLRKIISSQVRSVLAEDYARGIPDFAFRQIATKAVEGVKVQLRNHILMVAHDPVKERQMLAAANETLEGLEQKIVDLLEDSLFDFSTKI